jgi:hypothetical protein
MAVRLSFFAWIVTHALGLNEDKEMNLTNIKTSLKYSWPILIIIGLALLIGGALFSGVVHAEPHIGHGYYGGYHGGPAYYGGHYVRIRICGGFRYAPYYPYYTGYINPAWVMEYVEVLDPNCNCYVTIRVYVDQFGNTYSVP